MSTTLTTPASNETTRSELVTLVRSLQEQGKRVGFTSGVFDLLHDGHVDYLTKARQLCDVLVVAVNADSSVRKNKGPLRPICPEQQRVKLVEALQCVDHAFIFEEANNNVNINELKPDLYIKAGDYDVSQLSSAPIVQAYGGEVALIPLVHTESSSSGIIETILTRYAPEARETSDHTPPTKPAVFLDRDGTINKHIEYLHEPEKFEFLPGALEGLKRFHEMGYYLVVVTNQPGIGFGYFSVEQFFKVNKAMLKGCSEAGVLIDKIYFCPDTQATGSKYRKPQTGMIDRALKELPIQMERSLVIGDMESDVGLAKNAGIASIKINSAAHKGSTEADSLVTSIAEAAQVVASGDLWA